MRVTEAETGVRVTETETRVRVTETETGVRVTKTETGVRVTETETLTHAKGWHNSHKSGVIGITDTLIHQYGIQPVWYD